VPRARVRAAAPAAALPRRPGAPGGYLYSSRGSREAAVTHFALTLCSWADHPMSSTRGCLFPLTVTAAWLPDLVPAGVGDVALVEGQVGAGAPAHPSCSHKAEAAANGLVVALHAARLCMPQRVRTYLVCTSAGCSAAATTNPLMQPLHSPPRSAARQMQQHRLPMAAQQRRSRQQHLPQRLQRQLQQEAPAAAAA